LLSTAGIPKLRKISKDKLRFKGKGNEVSVLVLDARVRKSVTLTISQFTDMARLLNTYQLWLDDLFPKAKFLDGLAMIEKLGHKKKIQIYRKEWIDEGKPRTSNYEDDMDNMDDFTASHEDQASEQLPWEAEQRAPEQSHNALRGLEAETRELSVNNVAEQSKRVEEDGPDEDELDALLGEAEAHTVSSTTGISRPQEEYQGPDEDELDAHMAESEQTGNEPRSLFGGPAVSKAVSTERPPDDFEDEEEAMAGMDW
jgi:replication fork protection complex subunit Csm3/Swi3